MITEWIKQGLCMLESSASFQRRKIKIATKYQEAPFDEKAAEPEGILDLLTNRLNILRLDDEEDGSLFSFEHQDFQDILHYIYIEASFQHYQGTLLSGGVQSCISSF